MNLAARILTALLGGMLLWGTAGPANSRPKASPIPDQVCDTLISGSTLVKGKPYVSFLPSDRYLGDIKESNPSRYRAITSRYWVMRGDTIRYGAGAYEFATRTDLDTLFYFQTAEDTIPDTLLCFLDTPGAYEFVYNTCCNGFNLYDAGRERMPRLTVQFRPLAESEEVLLGRIESVGTLLKVGEQEDLEAGCRSAMSPNVYTVSLEAISLAGSEFSHGLFCYLNYVNPQDSVMYDYDFGYNLERTLHEFLYLPLSDAPLIIEYEPEGEVVTLSSAGGE